MLGKKCSLAPLKEELRKQGVSADAKVTLMGAAALEFTSQEADLTHGRLARGKHSGPQSAGPSAP